MNVVVVFVVVVDVVVVVVVVVVDVVVDIDVFIQCKSHFKITVRKTDKEILCIFCGYNREYL